MTVKNTIALAAFATVLSAYAFTVDSNMPAGKVIADGRRPETPERLTVDALI